MPPLATVQPELHALLAETAQEIHNARIAAETFGQEMQAFAAEAQELDLLGQVQLEECERELEALRGWEMRLGERNQRTGSERREERKVKGKAGEASAERDEGDGKGGGKGRIRTRCGGKRKLRGVCLIRR
ncbi:hypothetical protein G7Y79_00026g059380 [Physcia stellaris]|nr:hypothetical protein G7Y79_00026g059380 [Physcia stellaris]